MRNKYTIIGYYICEYTVSPSFLSDIFEKNISINGCLCNHEPQIFRCHGWKPNGDKQEYINCFSSKEKYIRLLGNDFDIEKNTLNEIDENIIGYDIIGWDVAGFHSFLCNSLQEQFPDVKFNSYGLLDETYSKTEQMSSSIQGMGEPVDWIPVMLHKIEI